MPVYGREEDPARSDRESTLGRKGPVDRAVSSVRERWAAAARFTDRGMVSDVDPVGRVVRPATVNPVESNGWCGIRATRDEAVRTGLHEVQDADGTAHS